MTNETLVSNRVHSLLTPDNCTLIMIDFQPQMAFGVKSIDGQTLINNAEGLAKSAKIFNVPTILTTVAEKSFSGPMFPQIKKVFPDKQMIEGDQPPVVTHYVAESFPTTSKYKIGKGIDKKEPEENNTNEK